MAFEMASDSFSKCAGSLPVSCGKGFFACSALNPGGGYDDPPEGDVEVSVEYACR